MWIPIKYNVITTLKLLFRIESLIKFHNILDVLPSLKLWRIWVCGWMSKTKVETNEKTLAFTCQNVIIVVSDEQEIINSI